MRDCQPGPWARKAAMTSWSRRSETCALGGPGGHQLGPMIGCDTVPRTVPVQSLRGDDEGERSGVPGQARDDEGGRSGVHERGPLCSPGTARPFIKPGMTGACHRTSTSRSPSANRTESDGQRSSSQSRKARLVMFAGPQPDQSIVVGTVTRDEVVVLGDQRQIIGPGMVGDDAIRCLPTEEIGNVRRLMTMFNKPTAQRRRKLCVDQEMHQAAAWTTA